MCLKQNARAKLVCTDQIRINIIIKKNNRFNKNAVKQREIKETITSFARVVRVHNWAQNIRI